MIDWLKKNKKFVKIRAIEQELNMPDSTLIKAVNGVQKLPKKWKDPLNKFVICNYNNIDKEQLNILFFDFFMWFRSNGENHINVSIEDMVKIYIKENFEI